MENIVHPMHGIFHRLQIPHITDIKADLICRLRHFFLQLMAHIILLLFIPGENADLPDLRIRKAVEHRIPKGTCAAADE